MISLALMVLAALAAIVLVVLPLWTSGRPLAIVTAVATLVIATSVYFAMGQPRYVMQSPLQSEPTLPDIEQMTAELARQLEANPDDRQGWLMLGRTYLFMERYDDAVQAFRNALALDSHFDLELNAAYAESLVLQDTSSLQGVAGSLFEKILAEDPDNIRGLWYGGLKSLAEDNTALARERWTRLLALPDVPDALSKVVNQRLESIAPAATLVRIDITGDVTVEPGSVLFIFLRHAAGGQPVAAKRVVDFELPLAIELTERDLLVDSLPANSTNLVIGASISETGNPLDSRYRAEAAWNGSDSPVELELARQE